MGSQLWLDYDTITSLIMQSLVLLSVLGCACAVPFLRDTPEVVAEKARFQQLWNAQAAAAAAAPDDPVAHVVAAAPAHTFHSVPTHHSTFHHTPTHVAAPVHHVNAIPAATLKWSGPVAATVGAGVNGQIVPVSDTADVQAATAKFNAAYANALRATGNAVVVSHNPQPIHFAPAPVVQARWTGPVAATVPAGIHGSGPVMDTADVAAATAAFQQAYAAAVRATSG